MLTRTHYRLTTCDTMESDGITYLNSAGTTVPTWALVQRKLGCRITLTGRTTFSLAFFRDILFKLGALSQFAMSANTKAANEEHSAFFTRMLCGPVTWEQSAEQLRFSVPISVFCMGNAEKKGIEQKKKFSFFSIENNSMLTSFNKMFVTLEVTTKNVKTCWQCMSWWKKLNFHFLFNSLFSGIAFCMQPQIGICKALMQFYPHNSKKMRTIAFELRRILNLQEQIPCQKKKKKKVSD